MLNIVSVSSVSSVQIASSLTNIQMQKTEMSKFVRLSYLEGISDSTKMLLFLYMYSDCLLSKELYKHGNQVGLR